MANNSVSKYKISDRNEENNLIQAAISGNHEKLSELLKSIDAVEYNKLLFHTSENYMTPLHLAAGYGHIICVQILIEHGANVNAEDKFGSTALHMAAEKGNYLCLKSLLDAGADCCLPTKFSKSGRYRTAPYLGGTTALHLAAANNHLDCVQQLIEYGADYNAIDEWGRTSLHVAAEHGFSKCVLTHLKNDIGRVIFSLPEFKNNDTPLHLTVFHSMVDCVRELLHLGSDVNCLNNCGHSPLHQALLANNTTNSFEILKLLILDGYNTNINLCDSRNCTPLHYVCFNNYGSGFSRTPQKAQFLISYGANVNIKNHFGTGLLEAEMKSAEEENGILLFIVRSMLQLPPLTELGFNSQREPHVHANDVAKLSNIVVNDLRQRLSMRRLGHEPEQANILNYFHFNIAVRERLNDVEQTALKPCVLEKIVWYEKLASNPRTLEHCCRYVIREILGSFRMKHVNKLPIPPALRSYVLLERD